MKLKKHKSVLVFLMLLMEVGVWANRMADETRKISHCGVGLTREKCQKQLIKARRFNCITEEEYNFSNREKTEEIRTPLCLQDDSDMYYAGWCFCSCFAEGTRLLVEDIRTGAKGWVAIEKVVEEVNAYRLIVPASHAALSHMAYDKVPIELYSSGTEERPLIFIQTANGSTLTLTPNHAIVLDTGKVVEAAQVKLGDHLVTHEGVVTEVVAKEERTGPTQIYNVLTSGENLSLSHLIFAEYLLVGDALWENSLESEIAAVQFPQ